MKSDRRLNLLHDLGLDDAGPCVVPEERLERGYLPRRCAIGSDFPFLRERVRGFGRDPALRRLGDVSFLTWGISNVGSPDSRRL